MLKSIHIVKRKLSRIIIQKNANPYGFSCIPYPQGWVQCSISQQPSLEEAHVRASLGKDSFRWLRAHHFCLTSTCQQRLPTSNPSAFKMGRWKVSIVRKIWFSASDILSSDIRSDWTVSRSSVKSILNVLNILCRPMFPGERQQFSFFNSYENNAGIWGVYTCCRYFKHLSVTAV